MTLGNREGVQRFEFYPGIKRNMIYESKTQTQITEINIKWKKKRWNQERSKHVVKIFNFKEMERRKKHTTGKVVMPQSLRNQSKRKKYAQSLTNRWENKTTEIIFFGEKSRYL